MNDQIILSITSILNLGIFFGLIYMVKQILDSEKVLSKHPYLRNPLLRMFLVMMIVGPLIVAINPSLKEIGHIMFDLGILGVLLMVGYLYDTYFLKVNVTYTSEVKAAYVGAEQYISIPSDKYIQVASGVWDRRMIHPDNWVSEDEKSSFEKSLDLFDFSKNVIVLCRFSEDALFAEHYHVQDESIFIIEGEVDMGEDLGKFSAGDAVVIPARHPHIFKAKTGGCCIIGLKKL